MSLEDEDAEDLEGDGEESKKKNTADRENVINTLAFAGYAHALPFTAAVGMESQPNAADGLPWARRVHTTPLHQLCWCARNA